MSPRSLAVLLIMLFPMSISWARRPRLETPSPASTITATAQTGKPAPAQTVTADGLEITLLSFERAPSRSVSLGGNCPPGGVSGTVQGVLKEGSALFTAKVRMKVLPAYKAGKDGKVVLLGDKDEKIETSTHLDDFDKAGKAAEYECAFQFVGADKAEYRRLQIGTAVLTLPTTVK